MVGQTNTNESVALKLVRVDVFTKQLPDFVTTGHDSYLYTISTRDHHLKSRSPFYLLSTL